MCHHTAEYTGVRILCTASAYTAALKTYLQHCATALAASFWVVQDVFRGGARFVSMSMHTCA